MSSRANHILASSDLSAAISLLHGKRWQRAWAEYLGIDERLVRRWAKGDRPIPDWVHAATIEAMQQRVADLVAEIEKLSQEGEERDQR